MRKGKASAKRKWTEEEVSRWYQETGAITYTNKEDGNLIVRKPGGSMGWTVNWANPKSYLLQAVLLLFILAIIKAISW